MKSQRNEVISCKEALAKELQELEEELQELEGELQQLKNEPETKMLNTEMMYKVGAGFVDYIR